MKNRVRTALLIVMIGTTLVACGSVKETSIRDSCEDVQRVIDNADRSGTPAARKATATELTAIMNQADEPLQSEIANLAAAVQNEPEGVLSKQFLASTEVLNESCILAESQLVPISGGS